MNSPDLQLKEVYEPATGVAAAPSVVLELTEAAQAAQLTGATPPASVVLHLDARLNVISASGDVIISLPEALERLCTRVIPAFGVPDAATATALADWLAQQEIVDCFVVAAEPKLIRQVKDSHALVRGVLDCRGWPERELTDLRLE